MTVNTNLSGSFIQLNPVTATTLVLVDFCFLKTIGENMKHPTDYIQTPRQQSTTVRIDAILERRMKDFMLSRRRNRWLKFGK